ncbi:atypical rio rio1 protein kinase, partial [Plasmopara halstedii]
MLYSVHQNDAQYVLEVPLDVSQSVEYEHPTVNDFLRNDRRNIPDFFCKIGALNPMTTQELFDFVTNLCFADDAVDDHLEAVQRMIADRPVDRTNEEQVDEVLAYQDGTIEKTFVTAISRLELEQNTGPGSVVRGTRIMDLLNEEDDREIDSCDKEDDIDAEDD